MHTHTHTHTHTYTHTHTQTLHAPLGHAIHTHAHAHTHTHTHTQTPHAPLGHAIHTHAHTCMYLMHPRPHTHTHTHTHTHIHTHIHTHTLCRYAYHDSFFPLFHYKHCLSDCGILHLSTTFLCCCYQQTVENAICVLRNLTYHLDQVPEFRDGPTDTLDDDDDLDGDAHKDRVPRHHGSTKHHTSSSILPGCLLLCARPLTDDYAGISMPARVAVSDSGVCAIATAWVVV